MKNYKYYFIPPDLQKFFQSFCSRDFNYSIMRITECGAELKIEFLPWEYNHTYHKNENKKFILDNAIPLEKIYWKNGIDYKYKFIAEEKDFWRGLKYYKDTRTCKVIYWWYFNHLEVDKIGD